MSVMHAPLPEGADQEEIDAVLGLAQKALNRAKIALMSRPDSAFFTTIVFSLKQIFDFGILTACTNGTELRISPIFFLNLNAEERITVLVHEAMHVAYAHMERLMSRTMPKWNVACDHVINLQLKDRGFTPIAGWLCDEQYRDLASEAVYAALPVDPPPPPMQDLMPMPGDGSAPAEAKVKQDIQDILVRARMASKMAGDKAGTIPSQIEIDIDKLLNPKLPWEAILRKWFNAFAKADFSWRKPNRRFFPAHYLPSMFSETLDDLACAVDASSSVQDHEFVRFISEKHRVIKQYKPKKITLLTFNTKIVSIDVVTSAEALLKIKFKGRGGTKIEEVIAWANKNKPKGLLIFTDGEFHWPKEKCQVPVVWLIHNNPRFTAPYGRVIHYEI